MTPLPFGRRAVLRRRALEDYEMPETTGPHGLAEEVATLGLPIGGLGVAAERTGAGVGGFVVRGAQRRAAVRAAEMASERRLAEMAAPRAARTLQAGRGSGLLTDLTGASLAPEAAFNESASAAQEMHDAVMAMLKKSYRGAVKGVKK